VLDADAYDALTADSKSQMFKHLAANHVEEICQDLGIVDSSPEAVDAAPSLPTLSTADQKRVCKDYYTKNIETITRILPKGGWFLVTANATCDPLLRYIS